MEVFLLLDFVPFFVPHTHVYSSPRVFHLSVTSYNEPFSSFESFFDGGHDAPDAVGDVTVVGRSNDANDVPRA